MDDNILIVMVGLPRSGKTTWAKLNMGGCPIVCPDSIRLALHGERFIRLAEPFVWAIAKAMVRALFLAGHDRVIVDGCHVKRKYRDEWLDKGNAPGGGWRTIFQVNRTPKETCIERARELGDSEIIPIIEKMADEWEPILTDEEELNPLPGSRVGA